MEKEYYDDETPDVGYICTSKLAALVQERGLLDSLAQVQPNYIQDNILSDMWLEAQELVSQINEYLESE